MNKEMEKYYDVLGITAEASDQEVYDACGFNHKFYIDHPNLATVKIKYVMEAYNRIMEYRHPQERVPAANPNVNAAIEPKQEKCEETPDEETKKCPFCAETIKLAAIRCRYCLTNLNPDEFVKVEELKQNIAEEKSYVLEKQAQAISQEVPKIKEEASPAPEPKQEKIPITPAENPAKRSERLYEAYLGAKNRIYYIVKFEDYDRKPAKLKLSWNWAAFFGNGAWALYRKMYGWFFICVGIALLAALLQNNGLSFLSLIVLLLPWLAFSAFANILYYRNAKEKISAAQLAITDKSKLPEFLRHEGGVHTWVTWVGSSLAAAVVLSAIMFTIIANYNQKAEKRTWTEPPRIEVPAPPAIPQAAPLAVAEKAAIPSAASLKQERLDKIRKAHPDFEKYRDDGSLAAWIKRQPGHLRDFLQKTYQEGDADSVIAILILFKNENKRPAGAAPLPTPAQVGKDLSQTAAYRPKNKIKPAPPKLERENKSQQEQNKSPFEDMVKISRESAEVAKSPPPPPPIPKEKVKTTLDIDQRFKGIKGIALNNGKVIEGQVISMGAELLKIRTKEGKVLSYSFEHEVQRFLKE